MKWLKIWINECLTGSVITELTAVEKGIWFMLLILAGKSITLGTVEKTKVHPYSEDEMLAHYLKCDHDTYQKTLKKLVYHNMIQIQEDGRILIVNWGKYQTFKPKKHKSIHQSFHEPLPSIIKNQMLTIFNKCWKEIRNTEYSISNNNPAEDLILRTIYIICEKKNLEKPLEYFEKRTQLLLKNPSISNLTMLGMYFDYDVSLEKKKEE